VPSRFSEALDRGRGCSPGCCRAPPGTTGKCETMPKFRRQRHLVAAALDGTTTSSSLVKGTVDLDAVPQEPPGPGELGVINARYLRSWVPYGHVLRRIAPVRVELA